jgi:hypothetical protein
MTGGFLEASAAARAGMFLPEARKHSGEQKEKICQRPTQSTHDESNHKK